MSNEMALLMERLGILVAPELIGIERLKKWERSLTDYIERISDNSYLNPEFDPSFEGRRALDKVLGWGLLAGIALLIFLALRLHVQLSSLLLVYYVLVLGVVVYQVKEISDSKKYPFEPPPRILSWEFWRGAFVWPLEIIPLALLMLSYIVYGLILILVGILLSLISATLSKGAIKISLAIGLTLYIIGNILQFLSTF